MASTVPWPPIAGDLQNRLVPTQEAHTIYILFGRYVRDPYIQFSLFPGGDQSVNDIEPFTPLSDQEMEQARRDNGNDPRMDHWTPGAKMRWLIRQPLKERHLHIRMISESYSEHWLLHNSTCTSADREVQVETDVHISLYKANFWQLFIFTSAAGSRHEDQVLVVRVCGQEFVKPRT